MNSKYSHGIEVLLIVIVGVSSWFCHSVPSPIVLDVLKALIGFAGLVVTIFGIWIAVIFPVLSGLLADGKARQEVSQLARYDVLVRALYRSCFALTVSFFVFLILAFHSGWSLWLARTSTFFSWLVFVAIAWALWSAIWNGESAVSTRVNDSVRIGLIRRIRGMGRSVRKRSGAQSRAE